MPFKKILHSFEIKLLQCQPQAKMSGFPQAKMSGFENLGKLT